MANRKLNFFSNNVKGLQNSTKRIKIFEYLKNNVTSDCFIFLQETHSNKDSEKRWSDEFKGQFFFLTWKNEFLRCSYSILWERRYFCPYN